jgi:hypothetical protein
VLLDLRADDDVVIPTYFFGTALMAELVRSGVFERGFPPEAGDSIVLDVDGESSDFGVHPVRGELVCYENREANPRTLRCSVEELTLNTLRRTAFYTLMARDLEITGQVTELRRGIWELGRKSLPGRDRSKVLFIERGVRETDLILCLMRDGYNTHCLLCHGNLPRQLEIPGKTTAQAILEVRDGHFVSEIFEDLAASQKPTTAETRIVLDESPPTLWICGQEFRLPDDRGRPTLGVLYLAALFDSPRESISCWALERKVSPRLKELSSVSFGADARMDTRAQRELDEAIKTAKAELDEARREINVSESEIAELESEFERLLDKKQADSGKAGKSRTLGTPDKEKARQRVRKALDAVVVSVEKQSPEVGKQLRTAVGEGGEILFNPPSDWEI